MNQIPLTRQCWGISHLSISHLSIVGLLPLALVAGVARSQTVPPILTGQPPLEITPRVGATFTTGPGVGYESSYGSGFGFVPLNQVPGQSILFSEGQLLLDPENVNLGGNFRIGYRRYLTESDLVLGGYIGYDIRNTGNSTFNQLGGGLEALGNGWEVRVNGYLPVGDRRRQVREQSFDTGDGNIFSGLRFTGNSLSATRTRLQVIDRTFESAMAGFDLEGGVKLASWDSGNLKAFVGTYLYSAPSGDSFLGLRTRLQAEINQNLVTGLALETDGPNGTRLLASIGVSFGGIPPQHRAATPAESIVARLGSGVARQETIAVGRQREVERVSRQEDVAMANPATGQPWRFVHVTPGAAGGTGSFESPLGEIAGAAVNTAASDGNNIIYVQGPGTVAGDFTIPNQVQLLSAAVPQFINSTQINTVQLPGSGTGIYPDINNTVALGSNAVISGFAITPPAGRAGIIANGVQTVTIRDNRVLASGNGAPGIFLQNIIGTAIAQNNRIITTGNPTAQFSSPAGILVDQDNTTLTDLILANNTISTNGVNAYGIRILPQNNSSIANATVTGNQITTDGGAGIFGVSAFGIFVSPLNNSEIGNATVSGNTVSTSGFASIGIFVGNSDNSVIANTAVSDNQITTSGDFANGIAVATANGSLINATVSGNTVSTSGNGADGISVGLVFRGLIAALTVSNNQIPQSGRDNVVIEQVATISQPICATITGNLGQNPGSDGFNFNLRLLGEPFRVVNLANLSANNNGGIFQFDGAAAPGANFVNVATCP